MAKRLPHIVIWSRFIERVNGETSIFENLLKQRYPSMAVTVLDNNINLETLAEDLKSAEVFIGDVRDFHRVIPFTPSLKWFHLTSAGINMVLEKCNKEAPGFPFKVTRMGDTYNSTIAEYVIAQIISRERQFVQLREEQKIKSWNQPYYKCYRSLQELTIGIVGAGDIGVEVARCCKCFGMKTIGLCRREKSEEQRSQFIDVYLLGSELSQLLAESDYICSILPSYPETDNFFDGDIFSHCTKKPVFINVGRGNCVQEGTIVTAIRNGWLSGAIIDVADPEPLPQDSKLWTMPEVIVTPHVSGFASEPIMYKSFVNNLEKFMKQQPLDYEIDFRKNY